MNIAFLQGLDLTVFGISSLTDNLSKDAFINGGNMCPCYKRRFRRYLTISLLKKESNVASESISIIISSVISLYILGVSNRLGVNP